MIGVTQIRIQNYVSQCENIQLSPSIFDKLPDLFLSGGISEVPNENLRLNIWSRLACMILLRRGRLCLIEARLTTYLSSDLVVGLLRANFDIRRRSRSRFLFGGHIERIGSQCMGIGFDIFG